MFLAYTSVTFHINDKVFAVGPFLGLGNADAGNVKQTTNDSNNCGGSRHVQ